MLSPIASHPLRNALLTGAVATLLSGCYSLAPIIIPPPTPEPTYRSVLVSPVPAEGKPDAGRFVQTATEANAPLTGSKVVININNDVRERIFCAERPTAPACKGRSAGSGSAADGQANAIETTAFVSDTERQLEKELIKRGFRVINRARLEAKLREMRDSRDDCKGSLSALRPACLQQLPEEAQRLIASFDQDRRAGKLSDLDFATKVAEVRDRFQYASAGRNRAANEMIDVSEVIRAAKDGEVGADFILLINGFRFETVPATINLNQFEQVRTLAAAEPAMVQWLTHNGTITCQQWAVQLDASLLHVRSGEVVWIGEHRVTEETLRAAGAEPLEITVSVDKRVTNGYAVQQAIDEANTETGRRRRAEYPNGTQIPQPRWGVTANARVTRGRCEAESGGATPTGDTLQSLTELVAGQLMGTIQTGAPTKG